MAITREKNRRVCSDQVVLLHDGYVDDLELTETEVIYPKSEIVFEKTLDKPVTGITVGAVSDDQASDSMVLGHWFDSNNCW